MTNITPTNTISAMIPEVYTKKLAINNILDLLKETVTVTGKVTYNFAFRLKTPLNGEALQING